MKRFGLLGAGLSHTPAIRVHAELGDYEYHQIEVSSEEELKLILGDLRFDGFNVTYPYRSVVLRYLDELSEEAARSMAVNVVKRLEDGRLKGYNTDMHGFRQLVNDSVEGKRCLLLGTGGAARSAAEVLEELGAERTVLVSRDAEEARSRLGRRYEITDYTRLYPYYDFEVVVNCTPVGKHPDIESSPLSDARISMRLFSNLELAIDHIYNPYRTKFLQDAKRLTRCNTKSGLDMMIIQALASRNIWFDKENDPEEEERVLRNVKRKILESQLNVVAVGLPGSGKTTIFRRYAYELGLKFIDSDEETEKLMGQPINDVLSGSGIGEEYFRAMEHQAVKEIAKERGSVIATGGGTLLNPLNRDMLRANGIIVYIKRPLEMLDIKGRPLSINIDLAELFNSRDRIYKKASDITLINSRIFGEKKAKTGEGNSYNFELKGFVYFVARRVQKYLNELASDKWT